MVTVEVMAKAKKWYMSKTLWLNALTLLAGIAAGLQGAAETGVMLTSLGVANIVLRVLTQQAVKW